ncbi:hypothetical protein KIW84_057848 [Lathyrus oleraceus]|uniref:Uncharacterized protein n=1 Tax=Pisum sativum TaxID=3888 RepID=A0A9D5AN74_PEA|nr:hypothetical protein KIW84_057848 [Pisum sativum]
MMKNFMATQTRKNKEFRNQNFHTSGVLRKLNIVVESLATHNKALETQIFQLAHTPLGPFPEGHVNIVTTRSEKQVEKSRENDKEVKESSGEKKVEIEKNPQTPPEKEVAEEVENETSYIVPPPYKSLIPFLQRFVEAKVGAKSKRFQSLLEA